ncbi:hypothetical protein PanWU01x14_219810 [Parasponia andersonii]|uniref:Transmembrane protein n=1 Tax=Parasponia andersonii TaxID=3476 RepID=A0A2P5BQD1_PARAD|nr:hypothetical protein PanWU01x14_219810 [Parasponia andersonii]
MKGAVAIPTISVLVVSILPVLATAKRDNHDDSPFSSMDPPLSSSSLLFPHRYLTNASSSIHLHDDQDFTIPKFSKNVGAYLCLGFSALVCIGLARQPPLFASCTILAFALCVNSQD